MSVLAGLNVCFILSSVIMLSLKGGHDVELLKCELLDDAMGKAPSSRRNVAAASSTRKHRCENVCVMNLAAGQRNA